MSWHSDFTPLENSTTELCYGLRGQFWRNDFGVEDVPDAHAWAAPLPPGNAKLLLRYQLPPLATDQYTLCTETFIYCPDKATQLNSTERTLMCSAILPIPQSNRLI